MQGKTEFTQFWHCPELGGLEVLKAQYQHKEFSKHVHEGYCINLIENGAQAFYHSGNMHVAPQGDIVLVNPDEVHTGSSIPMRCTQARRRWHMAGAIAPSTPRPT